MKRTVLTLSAGMAITFAAAQAGASGFLVARFGGLHGHAATDNPTAMYYNPAGLSLGVGTRLMIDANLAFRNVEYTRDPGAIDNPGIDSGVGTPTAGIGANSGKATLSNTLAAPFIGVASDLGVKGLGVGLGFYAPLGGTSVWDKPKANNSFGGQVDGPQRWWIMEGSIRSLYITGAASYKFEPLNLSIGFGVNYVINQVNTSRARNSDGTDNITAGNCGGDRGTADEECSIQEGRVALDVENKTVSFSAGVLWQPVDKMRIGVGYQASPTLFSNKLSGTADIIVGGGPQATDRAVTKAELQQDLPDIIRAAWVWEPSVNWQARLRADYERWSSFEQQCILDAGNAGRTCNLDKPIGKIAIIPRYWEDTFGFGGGGSYFLDETHDVEFNAGIEWDPSAVPDSTLEASLYDADKLVATIGSRFELMDDSLAVAVNYTQVFYADKTIKPRGRTGPDGAGPTTLAGTGLKEAERNPDAAGKYTQSVGVLNVNVEYQF